MKKLLVPTDFSENAFLAAKYAATICKTQGYSLHLVHYYTATSSGFDESEMAVLNEDSNLLKADITIKDWTQRLQAEFPTVNITYHNERGLLVEALAQEAKKDNYAAIVMGTTGATGAKNIFWGSNTAIITAKSPIPVIAVPNKPVHTAINRVGLLTNLKQEELITLQEFLHCIKGDIDLTLIHAHKEQESVNSLEEKLALWLTNIEPFNAVRNVNILTAPIVREDKNLDDIPEVISKIIADNAIDLILITKSRKTFFERLFTTSVSKAMTLDLQKPAFFGKTI
ncbi:universal stress protein [Sphingobacterium sp. JB170]|uniref:universal stress protein n=1 Tax=Sphingobacterium sp. JB170 TaxID=1434842 RepID=UPI000B3573FD|nr:universal stress protein [Sphingobacterium sp. JB170]